MGLTLTTPSTTVFLGLGISSCIEVHSYFLKEHAQATAVILAEVNRQIPYRFKKELTVSTVPV
ncbi:uncharacterized protein C8R40DRAFT_1130173 [Lentinula edodes]|uniref:uncharacterized protein n=1 Tax=Lentinula edodes TaxID=5353 RepID=UPI001E8DD353|nr:uncharacterized protein C8R40DRAFT_1130173 [Lentinula edodes]KAH7869631.1 hypothetical protein C8R40DRAFT_1130173 [Lentinula edodes]